MFRAPQSSGLTAALHIPANIWRDTPQRYGRISRWLHWSMAALFAWQFAGMLAKVALGKTSAWTVALSSAHAHVGLLLLLLLMVRSVWGLMNSGRRPSNGAGALGIAAWLGHLALYLLMFVVPFLALLRVWGNTRAFDWLGFIPLHQGGGEKVEWMVAPANAAHGLLGWVLLALIAGHVFMVLLHRFVRQDDVAQRMLGPVNGGGLA